VSRKRSTWAYGKLKILNPKIKIIDFSSYRYT